MKVRTCDHYQLNLHIAKRVRPCQPKCLMDYPSPVNRNACQLIPYVPNVIPSTSSLGANDNLDVVETDFVNRMWQGLRICKFSTFTKRGRRNPKIFFFLKTYKKQLGVFPLNKLPAYYQKSY